METVVDFILLGSKITADGDFSHKIKRHLLLGRNADQPGQRIKKQRHYFANKTPSSQSYGFSSSHSFSSKKQVSFNFMAAVTICGNFGAQNIREDIVGILFPYLNRNVSCVSPLINWL